MTIDLLNNFDFTLLSTPDFKEDSVREELILPILHGLGYAVNGLNRIIRSKTLAHPFVNIGSKPINITIVPDYILAVENKYAWVLDAKSPQEEITTGKNVEQAYSYAIHPDVRVKLYALCNGYAFSLFHIDEKQPLFYSHLSELNQHWEQLYQLLSPNALRFQSPNLSFTTPMVIKEPKTFSYSDIKQLPEIKDVQKQRAKRHFGIHPYFTKQVWNVVQEYIKNL